jgi:BirA family biotin operon repressor/biotin-[acetyl-CoA-carboxylase] ligase
LTDWPRGYGLVRLDEIDSTNREALRRAEQGQTGPLWLYTLRQTAGYGRRGRAWEGGDGNLMATLLLTPERSLAERAQLSFVTAIAAADMAKHFAPDGDIAVKWPNDILAKGEKLAGMLLEATGPVLAIGVGMNLTSFPPDTEFPATALSELGVIPPTPADALTFLAARFATWYEVWRWQGFAPIREAWLARALGMGTRIRARLATEERHGVFEGISHDGALLLNEAGVTRAIAAGEIYFG